MKKSSEKWTKRRHFKCDKRNLLIILKFYLYQLGDFLINCILIVKLEIEKIPNLYIKK